MAIFSCGKEATIEPVFVEKPFFKTSEKATASVIEFLNYTDFTETTLRSDFPDTEVNEGIWLLEASANYVDNVNLSYESDVTINYNLSIVNIIDNGIIKMSGADMTSKFDQLQSIISTEEQTNGRTAKIVDFELQSVSNQQTDLNIGVVYGNPPPPNIVGCEEWPASEYVEDAGETLEKCVLVGTNNYAWYQSISIIGDSNMSDCTEFGSVVLYNFDGIDIIPDDFDEAYTTCQDFITCKLLVTYGPPPPPNQNHIYGPPKLVDINLYGAHLSGNIAHLFCNSITLGRGVPY